MRCQLLSFFIGAVILPVAYAAPLTPCVSTTLDQLESTGGCDIGDLVFTNFYISNVSGTSIAASDIEVAPITSGSAGFTFTMPNDSGEDVIGFLATNTNGANTIEDLSLAISSGFTGAVENVCVGAGNNFNGPNGIASCTNTSDTAQLTAGYGNPASTSTTFSPVSAVSTSDGFILTGTSSSVSLTEQLSETPAATPEPASLGFAIPGVALLACVLRRCA